MFGNSDKDPKENNKIHFSECIPYAGTTFHTQYLNFTACRRKAIALPMRIVLPRVKEYHPDCRG